jgi:hypothetical protein
MDRKPRWDLEAFRLWSGRRRMLRLNIFGRSVEWGDSISHPANVEAEAGKERVKPLCIDLFCGLGGWSQGFLTEGWDVIGFDIERHDYGTGGYPAQLVLQDVLTLHGSQFRDAGCIVASPPCQGYSYRAMPWARAKALPPPSNELFDACFRIQREACEATGRYIPLIVENVCGAQKWVGRAKWHYGSYYLWGDVPALMSSAVNGLKFGGGWWHDSTNNLIRKASSRSPARKAASARISKIPFELARWIASVYKPNGDERRLNFPFPRKSLILERETGIEPATNSLEG